MAPGYFRLSVPAFSFLRGIIDVVVVACLRLIANRTLIEQACCDYILWEASSIWIQWPGRNLGVSGSRTTLANRTMCTLRRGGSLDPNPKFTTHSPVTQANYLTSHASVSLFVKPNSYSVSLIGLLWGLNKSICINCLKNLLHSKH